jgi:hypothetical protein
LHFTFIYGYRLVFRLRRLSFGIVLHTLQPRSQLRSRRGFASTGRSSSSSTRVSSPISARPRLRARLDLPVSDSGLVLDFRSSFDFGLNPDSVLPGLVLDSGPSFDSGSSSTRRPRLGLVLRLGSSLTGVCPRFQFRLRLNLRLFGSFPCGLLRVVLNSCFVSYLPVSPSTIFPDYLSYSSDCFFHRILPRLLFSSYSSPPSSWNTSSVLFSLSSFTTFFVRRLRRPRRPCF